MLSETVAMLQLQDGVGGEVREGTGRAGGQCVSNVLFRGVVPGKDNGPLYQHCCRSSSSSFTILETLISLEKVFPIVDCLNYEKLTLCPLATAAT